MGDIVRQCGKCGCDIVYTGDEAESMQSCEDEGDPNIQSMMKGFNIACDKCIVEIEAAENRKMGLENIRQMIRISYGTGMMPEDAKECRFIKSDPAIEAQNAPQWKSARKWKRRTNLWILGTPGTSKTFMARCLLNHSIKSAKTAAEMSPMKFAQVMGNFQSHNTLGNYSKVDVLSLDDIDKMLWNERTIHGLWCLMDVRASRKKRTIITSNATPEHMQSVWHAASPGNDSMVTSLLDRLLPMERIEMTGDSVRRNK